MKNDFDWVTKDTKFTREMAYTYSPEQVSAFWRAQNRARRDAGMDHYTVCLSVNKNGTERIVDRI